MKPIYMTEETKTQVLQEILDKAAEQLNGRAIEKISISKTISELIPKPEQKAIIDFMPMAWLQMRAMVEKSKEECAWHGTVTANEERTVFQITQLLPYPQRIAGMTVEDDDPKYEEWHQALDNETYNSLRMQGHSHVSAAASPSGRDNSTYQNYLNALSHDSFYIFMITNNRGECWFNIYDLQNNRLWENSDIIMTIGNTDLNKWYAHIVDLYYAKKPVHNRTTTIFEKTAFEQRYGDKVFSKRTAKATQDKKPRNVAQKEMDDFFSSRGDTLEDRAAINHYLMNEDYERRMFDVRS